MLEFFSLFPHSLFSSYIDSLRLLLVMPITCVWSRYWIYHHCKVLPRKSWVVKISIKGHSAIHAFCRRSPPQDAMSGFELRVHCSSFLSQPRFTFLYPNVFSSDDFDKSFDPQASITTRLSWQELHILTAFSGVWPSEASQPTHKQSTSCTFP